MVWYKVYCHRKNRQVELLAKDKEELEEIEKVIGKNLTSDPVSDLTKQMIFNRSPDQEQDSETFWPEVNSIS